MHVQLILVRALVIAQPVGTREASTANIAHVRLHITMNMHVLFEVTLVSETSTTHIASKWFFSSVRSFVIVVSAST